MGKGFGKENQASLIELFRFEGLTDIINEVGYGILTWSLRKGLAQSYPLQASLFLFNYKGLLVDLVIEAHGNIFL